MLIYSDINFGEVSAEQESTDYPELIEKGFLDPHGIIPALIKENRFLILGNKGSGKSEIAQKLISQSLHEATYFTNIMHLYDFPFKSFSKIIAGNEELESKLPTTWSWLLLLYFIESFSKDNGSPSQYDPLFCRALKSLTQLGLLPTQDLNSLVVKSSKNSFKVSLPKFIETTFEDANVPIEADMQFMRLVDHLKKLICQFNTNNKHILIVDGLDEILLGKEIQFQSLSALVYETNRLNNFFVQNKSHAKIILLCRTDLYERLPGPNKNKIRQDCSYELDWYHDPRSPRDSLLAKLANFRASIQFKQNIDIFSSFFPNPINDQDIVAFLLDRTRHTPRDFLQLLNHLKPFYQNKTFTYAQILSGIREYSLKYFLPEIMDELSGYVPTEHFKLFRDIFGATRHRVVSYDRLYTSFIADGRYTKKDFDIMLNTLYECSAIGNTWNSPDGSKYEFKYRNRYSSFSIQNDVVLHNGLWKALNIGN
jgi:hypothetical protein